MYCNVYCNVCLLRLTAPDSAICVLIGISRASPRVRRLGTLCRGAACLGRSFAHSALSRRFRLSLAELVSHDLPQLLPSAQQRAVRLVPSCRPVRRCSSGSSRPRQQNPEWSSCHTTLPPSAGDTAASGCNTARCPATPTQLKPWLHLVLCHYLFASLLEM